MDYVEFFFFVCVRSLSLCSVPLKRKEPCWILDWKWKQESADHLLRDVLMYIKKKNELMYK